MPLEAWDIQHRADNFVGIDLSGVNRPNLELWLTDLETTDDPQTEGRLTDSNGDCCLGRQCKVSIAAGLPVTVDVRPDGWVKYDDQHDYPPQSVQQWLGITSLRFYERCSDLNDSDELSFKDIAQVLRAVFA